MLGNSNIATGSSSQQELPAQRFLSIEKPSGHDSGLSELLEMTFDFCSEVPNYLLIPGSKNYVLFNFPMFDMFLSCFQITSLEIPQVGK